MVVKIDPTDFPYAEVVLTAVLANAKERGAERAVLVARIAAELECCSNAGPLSAPALKNCLAYRDSKNDD